MFSSVELLYEDLLNSVLFLCMNNFHSRVKINILKSAISDKTIILTKCITLRRISGAN